MDQKNDGKRIVLQSSDELKGRNAARSERSRFAKLLPVLIAAAVILLACLIYALNAQKKAAPPEAAADPEISLIETEADQLVRVGIARAGEPAYVIERKSTAGEEVSAADFEIADQPGFSIDLEKVRPILTDCIHLNADRAVESSGSASDYGLDAPAVTVTIDYADGTSKELRIGDQTPTEKKYYLQMTDDDRVFLISASTYLALSRSLNDLHALALPVQISADSFDNLLIEREGEETVELRMTTKLQQAVSSIELVQPILYDAHPSRAGSIVEDFCALKLAGYAGHADSAEALAAYGLDRPRMRIVFTDKSGAQLDCRIGAENGAGSYAAVDDTGDVYIVNTADLGFVGNARVSYLIDQFVNLVNLKCVDGLTITGEGVDHTLSIDRSNAEGEGDPTEESICDLDGVSIPESTFKTLYQSVVSLICDGMTDDHHFEGKAALRIEYHLNSGEDLVVEYVDYDDENYVVRRDGVTLLTIQKNKVRAMLETFAESSEKK